MASRITGYLRNNVLGLIAIFIALGAGAYAAGLPKNSVKSKQIKAAAVKSDELADNAVTSPKVADGSLLGEDFAAGQLLQGPRRLVLRTRLSRWWRSSSRLPSLGIRSVRPRAPRTSVRIRTTPRCFAPSSA